MRPDVSVWRDFMAAVDVLADKVARSSSNLQSAAHVTGPVLSEADLVSLLDGCGPKDRHAFFDRGTNRLALGLGCTAQFDYDANVELKAETVAFGGWRFDTSQTPAPEWEAFGRGDWVTPTVFVISDSLGSRIGVSAQASVDDARAELARLRRAAKSERTLAAPATHPVESTVSPTFEEWSKSISSCLATFASGDASKVVLARRTTVHFAEPVSPVATFERWCSRESGGYAFFIEREDAVFLGVTPELLWRGEGHNVRLEAVAGTRARGMTEADDEALANALLHDDKELREHAAVKDFIVERIPECDSATPPQVRKLRHVQHLVTPLEAPRPDASVLNALAPTPAVCGVPRDRAFAEVAALEAFDRGFYAGGVGVRVGTDETVAVGIRSLLVRGSQAMVFAGAGLVAGSSADNEWREIATKERGAKEALGLDPSTSLGAGSSSHPSSPSGEKRQGVAA